LFAVRLPSITSRRLRVGSVDFGTMARLKAG
jgi:hypothetical protein